MRRRVRPSYSVDTRRIAISRCCIRSDLVVLRNALWPGGLCLRVLNRDAA